MRTCSICNMSFSRPYTLRRHMENIHPSSTPVPLERQRGFGKSRKDIDQCNQYGSGYRKISSDDNDDDNGDDDDEMGRSSDDEEL